MTTKDIDLKTLESFADAIETTKERLAAMIDGRRLIWERRLKAKDTTKAELARASRCHPQNVTEGLRSDLVKEARKRGRKA